MQRWVFKGFRSMHAPPKSRCEPKWPIETEGRVVYDEWRQNKHGNLAVSCICCGLRIAVGVVSMGFLGFVGMTRRKRAKAQLDKGVPLAVVDGYVRQRMLGSHWYPVSGVLRRLTGAADNWMQKVTARD